ncbi:hypothetical protein OAS86_00070 [Gammaproteobacteria bacterium]|nr:hypothetical protein [Gammaproteobacteria bacterium]
MESSAWLAVIGSGLYHGLNPGMGWPLAVSAGLMGRGQRDLLAALPPLAIGHLAAMLVVLLPFALLTGFIQWQREIRVGAALLIIAVGLVLLIWRRHPRFLARIPPAKLTLWSFAIATAHGAGLMLLPAFYAICGISDTTATAMQNAGSSAALVAILHTLVMICSGGFVAWLVFRWLGLKFLNKSWFNLDVIWALSLVIVGLVSLWTAW